MARSTHEQRERADRHDHAERRRATRLVLAIVTVLVVAAMMLGAVLLNRGGDGARTDSMASASASDELEAGNGESATSEDGDAGNATDDEGTGSEGTGSGTAPDQDVDAATVVEPCPPTNGDVPTPTTTVYGEPPTVDLGEVETVRVTVSTTCGTIVLELGAAAAPTTVGSFVALAEDGYYEGVGFHRVIEGFMVQGGDPTGTGTGCLDDACTERLPGYTFPDELGLAEETVAETGGYPRGTIAMANSGPDTNGSQFFIVQASPGYPLPPDYAVFGQVVEGMDVVDRIAQGPVDGDLAVDPVVIRSIEVDR